MSDTMRARELLEELRRTCSELQQEKERFLGRLRSLTVGLSLSELSEDSDDRILGVLHLTKHLIDLFWYNFGTDASFSSPARDLEADRIATRFASGIGCLVESGLQKNESLDSKALDCLCEAIASFYSLVAEFNRRAEERDVLQ